MSQEPVTPEQKMRQAYEETEKQWSKTAEQIVSSRGFAEGLGLLASNAVALTRMANIGLDQLVRATRLAGRNDITRLGRQLNRTEDKLEHVLQVVEQLEEELVRTREERDEARRSAGGSAPKAGGEGK